MDMDGLDTQERIVVVLNDLAKSVEAPINGDFLALLDNESCDRFTRRQETLENHLGNTTGGTLFFI